MLNYCEIFSCLLSLCWTTVKYSHALFPCVELLWDIFLPSFLVLNNCEIFSCPLSLCWTTVKYFPALFPCVELLWNILIPSFLVLNNCKYSHALFIASPLVSHAILASFFTLYDGHSLRDFPRNRLRSMEELYKQWELGYFYVHAIIVFSSWQ